MKKYNKPQMGLTSFKSRDKNMVFASANINSAKIKFSKTEINKLNF